MPITNQPTNPHNNTSPNILNIDNYADPFELATLIQSKAGLPTQMVDKIQTDCESRVQNNWLGWLTYLQNEYPVNTDWFTYVETQQPDYVIDDDGAVTRSANEFTIDWTAVEGYEAGEDAFFYRVDDTIAVYDNSGKEEIGVITAVDKANNKFTAVPYNGSTWTVDISNLTIDINGGDFDKMSCAPEGLMELRKKKTRTQKLITIKDAIKTDGGGTQYEFCFEDGEVRWYDDNTLAMDKRLDLKVAKSMIRGIEAVSGSGAHQAGKYGTLGVFQNIKQNGLTHTGYIQTKAHLQALTTYWDSLGFAGKTMYAHVDMTQVRYFEEIASEIATSLNVQISLVLNNKEDNDMRFGFSSLTVDGYTIKFTNWGLTSGNSAFGKKRISEAMPIGIIMPIGTVETIINGEKKQVPYLFKVYKNLKLKPGKVRTYMTGGLAGGNGSSCEYLELSKSTTVAVVAPCPEALTIIVKA